MAASWLPCGPDVDFTDHLRSPAFRFCSVGWTAGGTVFAEWLRPFPVRGEALPAFGDPGRHDRRQFSKMGRWPTIRTRRHCRLTRLTPSPPSTTRPPD